MNVKRPFDLSAPATSRGASPLSTKERDAVSMEGFGRHRPVPLSHEDVRGYPRTVPGFLEGLGRAAVTLSMKRHGVGNNG
jgi:hypothetical protein